MKVRLKGTGQYQIAGLKLCGGEVQEIDDPVIIEILKNEKLVELDVDDAVREYASKRKNVEQLMDGIFVDLCDKWRVTLSGKSHEALAVDRVNAFLGRVIANSTVLSDVRTVMANANGWKDSRINFTTDVPTFFGAGEVDISAVLLKGEVPISDTVLNDQITRPGFGGTVLGMVAEGFGRDIEELMMNGDTEDPDEFLQKLDGWPKQARGLDGNIYNAIKDGKAYRSIMEDVYDMLPERYKKDTDNMRFYVPYKVYECGIGHLQQEGVGAGGSLRCHDVEVRPLPLMNIKDGRGSILLTHRKNLYAAFRREVNLDRFRDPRADYENSIVIAMRVDAKIAHVPATAIAINVEV